MHSLFELKKTFFIIIDLGVINQGPYFVLYSKGAPKKNMIEKMSDVMPCP